MKTYSEEFMRQLDKVESLKTELRKAKDELQKLCPHVDTTGRSMFPRGLSFTDCRLCGISSHDA